VEDDSFRRPLLEVLGFGSGFGHREHLLLAWRYLRLADQQTAECWMRQAIRHVATGHGTPDKYHETLTMAWIRIVAAHGHAQANETFEHFIARCPGLLDQRVPERHFSPGVLWSDEARAGWVAPDLVALP
jgi:hypothetical protein